MNPLLMILGGWLFMAVVMLIFWGVQRRTGDAGIVDVVWGMGVGILAVCFAAGSIEGDVGRRIVVGTLAMVWAVRLSGHVLVRVMTMPEDGRYQTLKKTWGPAAQARMLKFYQFQAVGSLLFALPMLAASRNQQPWTIFDTIGCVIWVVAIAGESIADRQLARFRSNSSNHGQVCQQGLWHYSRHPNYFFEWLHWWSYVFLAAGSAYGWLTILAPMAMLYFVTKVTGIPPTEAQAIKSRGDAYREYQRTTSAFFPWFPRKSNHAE